MQHAISVLGFKAIRNLVPARSVFNSFKSFGSKDQFDIRQFWIHSFLCSLATKVISADIKGDKNDFLIAGLIHDIGKLIIYMILPVQFVEIIEISAPPKLRTYKAKKSTIGISHDEVGMSLLKKWMFPDNLISAIRFHHRPFEAENEQLSPLVVFEADLLVHISDSQEENEAINAMKQELFSPEINKAFQSHEIEWDESRLADLQQEFAKKKELEAEALNLLFY